MSVLDTFYLLFKTDADKAADDIDDVAKSSDKAAAGMRAADVAAAAMGRSFIGMAASLAAPLIALVSLSAAIDTTFGRIQAIGDIGDAAFKLRSSAQDYDAFTRAVRAAGGELEAAQANLTKFSDKLNDAAARPDGPNAKNFAKWGIIFKDVNGEAVGAVDGLLALAKSLEGVSQAEALGRLRRLGIDDADTIDFLMQGKDAIIARMEAEKKAGVVTDRQIELEGKYQAAVGKTRNLLDTMANATAEAFMPLLIKGFDAFSKALQWLIDNKTLVEGFFVGIATVVTVTFFPAMMSAAAATLAATWPFVLLAGAVAALGSAFALAYEDIKAYAAGQDSLLGKMAEKHESVAAAAKNIGIAWKVLSTENSLKDIEAMWGRLSAAVEKAWAVIRVVWDDIKSGVGTLQEKFDQFFTAAAPHWEDFKRNAAEAVADFQREWDKLGEALAGVVDKMRPAFNKIKEIAGSTFDYLADKSKPLTDKLVAAAKIIEDAFTKAFKGIVVVWENTVGAIMRYADDTIDRATILLGKETEADKRAKAAADAANAKPVDKSKPLKPGETANDNAPKAEATSTAYILRSALWELFKSGGINPDTVNPQTPLASQNSATLKAASSTVNNDIKNDNRVNVGGVVIHAPGADAKAIAAQIDGALAAKIKQTQANFDDGVAR